MMVHAVISCCVCMGVIVCVSMWMCMWVCMWVYTLITYSPSHYCVRSALLERMPLPDVKASATVNDTNGAGESLPTEGKICGLHES